MKKLIILFSVISLSLFANLDEEAMNLCMKNDFQANVSHRTFPLGLMEKKINITKERCLLNITHQSFFVWNQGWKIDVCREPIHIKKGYRSVEVLKRRGECGSNHSFRNGTEKEEHKEFCDSLITLEEVIQNDGLIFAEGEKEEIKSDHGMVYCAYVLVQRYLKRGEVLSRFSKLSAYDKFNQIPVSVAQQEQPDRDPVEPNKVPSGPEESLEKEPELVEESLKPQELNGKENSKPADPELKPMDEKPVVEEKSKSPLSFIKGLF